jgi:transposase-like protein
MNGLPNLRCSRMPLSQMVAPYSPAQTRSAHRGSRGPKRHLPYFIRDTNAIESINARYRRAVRARGHFPNDTAALKCLYLVTRALDPMGRGRARWAIRRRPALNAFAIAFQGRIN